MGDLDVPNRQIILKMGVCVFVCVCADGGMGDLVVPN